jgi:flagellar hook-length control protein FliK
MLSEQGIALGDSSVSQGSQQQQQDGLPQRGGPITEIQQDDSLAHVTPAADLRQTGQADGKINIYI